MATARMFNEEPTAHYFHASLFKFDTTARAAVINAFNARVGNIAAKCSYNAKKDLFSLDCPSSQGDFCDEQLYAVITRYVEEEQDVAVREERSAHVQRFVESKWEWDHDRAEGSEYAVDVELVRTPLLPAVTTHTVVISDELKNLKFFRMHQLPEAFIRRSLCPQKDNTQVVFIRGLTCRAVCWKSGQGFVFNGRDGANSLHDGSGFQHLEFPDFPVLSDTRDQAVLDALDLTEQDATVTSREHVGSTQGVDVWLQGVDLTRQIGPDERADLPKSTMKLLAADEMHVSGRPRVPKGYIPGIIEQDVPSDDESAISMAVPSFGDTMLPGRSGHELHVSSFSDSEESSESEIPTVFASRGGRSTPLIPPIPENENSIPAERIREWTTASTSVQTTARTRRQSSYNRTEPAGVTSPYLQSNAPHSTVQESAQFTEYDKKYAIVDNYGLTANPYLSASYALEHDISTSAKPKRQPIVSRTQKPNAPAGKEVGGTVPNGRSEASSVSAPVASAAVAPEIDCIQAVVPPKWEQSITNKSAPTVGLVDARSTPLLRPLVVPSGLADASREDRQRNVISTQQTETNSLVDAADIDLLDRSPPCSSTMSRPTAGQILQPALARHQQTNDDNVATEKLAFFPPGFDRKRNTMNQKVGRNSKSKAKKSNTASGKNVPAQLPMPDPLPAPRVKNIAEVPKPPNRRQGPPVARPSVQDQPPFANEFQQLLHETIEKQSMSDNEDDDNVSVSKAWKLVVEFCQLLLLPEESSFANHRAATPGVFQELMNSSKPVTQYFPRLTSSLLDANALVKLIGAGNKTPELVYEIRMKISANRTVYCTIPVASKAMFTVTARDDAFVEFLHYPVHVWDARMSLIQPGVDRMSLSYAAIELFVSSMTTEENAPSFCASVDESQLEVEAVYANRIFERFEDGITFRVIEKRLLEHGNHRGGRHNFHAVVYAEEEMIYDQRLWWEAMMETHQLQKRDQLLDIITSMIEKMDSIGIENDGPWKRGDEEEMVVAPQLLYDDLGRAHLSKLKSRSMS